jgi:hypothetical protein
MKLGADCIFFGAASQQSVSRWAIMPGEEKISTMFTSLDTTTSYIEIDP